MRIVPVTIRDGGTFYRKEREDERSKKGFRKNNIVVFYHDAAVRSDLHSGDDRYITAVFQG